MTVMTSAPLATDETEREIERRVAERCQAEAILWRFRLIMTESVMMALLVAAAGIALDKPIMLIMRVALLVGASCFASGMLLLGITGLGTKWARRLRSWRSR